MENKKDYYGALDLILEDLHKNNGGAALFATSQLLASYKFETKEVNEVYQKLIDDGFIREVSAARYNLTFNGYVFVQDGMYKEKNLRAERSVLWDRELNTSIRKSNEKLASWTKILGVGTVAFALIELIKFLHELGVFDRHSCHYD